MMMKLNKTFYLSLVAFTLLASCKRSGNDDLQADSPVSFVTVADGSLNVVTKAAQTYDIPLPEGFTLTINNGAGEKVLEDTEFSGVKNVNVPRGDYKAVVTSGPALSATFEAPSYKGEADFTAVTGQQTQVDMIAKLNCVVVDVNFSENLRKSFKTVSAQVWAATDGRLVFATDNEKLAYFTATTKLNYSIAVTTWQGVSYTAEGVCDKLKSADLLCLNFDIDGKLPDMSEPTVFDITLDRVINEISSTHILGATMESYPAPSINGRRVDISKPVGVKYKAVTNVNLDIVTEGGLDKVFLIVGDRYTEIAGMKAATVNLMDPEVQTALGVNFVEGGAEGGLECLLNLVGLTPKLPGSEAASHEFKITIGVLDQNGQYTVRDVIFNVFGSNITTLDVANNVVDWFGVYGPINKVNVKLKGRYNVDIAPEEMQFYYRVKDSGADWSTADATETTDKQVEALLSLPGDGLTYEYKLVAGDTHATPLTFVNAAYPAVYNMNFDNWHVGGNSTYYPYPSGASAAQKMWDTGNYGLTSASSMASFSSNSIDDTGYQGKGRSAKLSAVVAKKLGIGHFAPGNLFTGYFNFTSIGDAGEKPWVMPHFGVPFVGLPKQMKGYFKYSPKNITDREFDLAENLGKVGDPDECEIYVKLEKWNGADGSNRNANGSPVDAKVESIGYGVFRTKATVNEFTEFSFNVEYYQQNVLPDHIIIVATSSRWGGYLTGGNGSTLWVDNFEFVY